MYENSDIANAIGVGETGKTDPRKAIFGPFLPIGPPIGLPKASYDQFL